MLTGLIFYIACFDTYSQKRYGYTVLYFRCGDNEPGKDRVYYSPIIELNTLNFPQYTDGVDPAFAKYSVRYYNYAISKWFESFLSEKHKVMNSLDRYARHSNTVIYNDSNGQGCDIDKTNNSCFFLNREELSRRRKQEINESRAKIDSTFCEVIDL